MPLRFWRQLAQPFVCEHSIASDSQPCREAVHAVDHHELLTCDPTDDWRRSGTPSQGLGRVLGIALRQPALEPREHVNGVQRDLDEALGRLIGVDLITEERRRT